MYTWSSSVYRKLNNSEYPPVCKKFTSIEYLSPSFSQSENTSYIWTGRVQRKKLDNKCQWHSAEHQNQASSGLQQFHFQLQLLQAPNNSCTLGPKNICWDWYYHDAPKEKQNKTRTKTLMRKNYRPVEQSTGSYWTNS